MMMRFYLVLPTLCSILLAGCGDKEAMIVEDIPANVQRNIELLELPKPVWTAIDMYGGVDTKRNYEPGRVSWVITQDGNQLGTYDVTITPTEDGKTSITKNYVAGQSAAPSSGHVPAANFAAEGLSAVIGQAVDRAAAAGESLKVAEAEQLLRQYGDKAGRAEAEALKERLMRVISSQNVS